MIKYLLIYKGYPKMAFQVNELMEAKEMFKAYRKLSTYVDLIEISWYPELKQMLSKRVVVEDKR